MTTANEITASGGLLKAALDYATRGWPVLPLYTPAADSGCDCPDIYEKGVLIRHGGAGCLSPGKHPRTKHGYLDATTDEARIRRWWKMWPQANVGIRTGRSSGLLVIDVDPRNGGDVSLEHLGEQHGPLPDTVEALTGGGGRHIVLAYPTDGSEVRDAKLGAIGFPGIEIKAEGGLIVAAPSHHYTGGTYAWDITCQPDDIELAPSPAWLLQMLAVGAPGSADGEPLENEIRLPLGYAALTFVANGAPLGEQRDSAVRATRNYLSAGHSVDDTVAAIWRGLQASPRDPTKPEWTYAEAEHLVRNVAASKAKPLKPLPPQPQRLLVGPKTNGHVNGRVDTTTGEVFDEHQIGSAPTSNGHNVAELPQIIGNRRQLRHITCEAIEALVTKNEPRRIFQRAAEMVRVVEIPVAPLFTKHKRTEQADPDETRPAIQPLQEAALRGELARVADWVLQTAKGSCYEAPPPIEVVRDMAALAAWPPGIPALVDLIEAPALRADGSIILDTGYDASTGVFYVPSQGLKVPPIPSNPTADDLAHAVDVIDDVIGGFPFDGPASKPGAIALMLTPLLRACLGNAPAPMAVLDAPQQGSGKSLLARVVSIIAAGREPGAFTAPTDEAEWRKAITGIVREGSPFVLIDNVDLHNWQGDPVPLRSPALSALLTTSVHHDRILGVSTVVQLPSRATWALTGNNVQVGGDLIRRCYRIRIDAKTAHPWLRDGFTHPNLVAYVRTQRGVILAALLTLCRAWFARACPAPSTPSLGSFEAWSVAIGGILDVAGIKGFLSEQELMYATTDGETPEWEGFLTSWHSLFREDWHTIAELYEVIKDREQPLRDTVPSDLAEYVSNEDSFKKRLGKALKQRLGVRHGDANLYLANQDDTHDKVKKWRVLGGG